MIEDWNAPAQPRIAIAQRCNQSFALKAKMLPEIPEASCKFIRIQN
jgi:hypothetical protein